MTHSPSHISKMVLPTVQLGPPNYAIAALRWDVSPIAD